MYFRVKYYRTQDAAVWWLEINASSCHCKRPSALDLSTLQSDYWIGWHWIFTWLEIQIDSKHDSYLVVNICKDKRKLDCYLLFQALLKSLEFPSNCDVKSKNNVDKSSEKIPPLQNPSVSWYVGHSTGKTKLMYIYKYKIRVPTPFKQ